MPFWVIWSQSKVLTQLGALVGCSLCGTLCLHDRGPSVCSPTVLCSLSTLSPASHSSLKAPLAASGSGSSAPLPNACLLHFPECGPEAPRDSRFPSFSSSHHSISSDLMAQLLPQAPAADVFLCSSHHKQSKLQTPLTQVNLGPA